MCAAVDESWRTGHATTFEQAKLQCRDGSFFDDSGLDRKLTSKPPEEVPVQVGTRSSSRLQNRRSLLRAQKKVLTCDEPECRKEFEDAFSLLLHGLFHCVAAFERAAKGAPAGLYAEVRALAAVIEIQRAAIVCQN